MVSRTTLAGVHNQVMMSTGRASVREFDDHALTQRIKQADALHSETPSDFERFQMVGLTAVPLKQDEEKGKQQGKQQTQQSSSGGNAEGDWNHDQPKGDSASALMLYVGGSRSHPVALVDDRRVRPYDMKEGEAAFYDPSGSEQMMFMNEKGAYLVSLDGPDHRTKNEQDSKKKDKERFASLRHVTKKMQSHKIEDDEEGQQGGQGGQQQASKKQEEYKHEGDTVNTEVRCSKNRIEFRKGDKVMGYFDGSSDKWNFNGKTAEMDFSENFTRKANNIYDKPQNRYELEEDANSKVEGEQLFLAKKVWIKKDTLDVEGAAAAAAVRDATIVALEQRIADLERRILQLES